MNRVFSRRTLRKPSILSAVFVLGFVVSGLARPTAAQGLPFLPDPVSTRELMDYSERLHMSNQQKQALLPLHDDYFEQYEKLREGDIQEFQDDLMDLIAQIRPMELKIPPRAEIEALIDQIGGLLKKVKQVDRRFFDQISTILSTDQMLLLDHVRSVRERQMYQQFALQIGSEFNPGAGVDLTEFIARLDLTSNTKELTTPLLNSYEKLLLSKVRRLHKEIEAGAKIILDVIDELGIREMTLEDFAQLNGDEGFLDRIRNIFNESSRPFQKAVSDISQLNLRTYRRLRDVLPARPREALQDRFYSRVYPQAIRGLESTQKRFKDALHLQGLSSQQKQQIQTQREAFQSRTDSYANQIASLIEDSREYRTFGQLNEDESGNPEKRIDDAVERRDQIIKSSLDMLQSILGPDLYAALNENSTPEHDSSEEWTVIEDTIGQTITVRNESKSSEDESERQSKAERDTVLPGPITIAMFNRLADQLDADAQLRPIFDSLYDDYRESYDEIVSIPDERDAGEPGNNSPQRKALEQAKGRRDIIDAIFVADAEFFDNLEIVIGEGSESALTERQRITRQREAMQHSIAQLGQWYFQNNDARVDLSVLLEEIQLMPEDRNFATTALMAYDAQSISPLSELLETSLQIARLNALSEVMALESENKSQDVIRKRRGNSFQAQQAARGSIARLNREYYDQLINDLSPDGRWKLWRQYNRTAYPGEFGQESETEALLESVPALESLTSGQRDMIRQITTNYRDKYYNLGEELLVILKARDNFQFDGSIPVDMIEREIRGEHLRFLRRELEERSTARLQLLLTDEQRMQTQPVKVAEEG